ncbi:MAG: hypothetical protein DHS20C11_24640 [Lysobacteraceae bacterium]|nr:MAG: hypothetical protein DHS20C11_24640 [Xanthomonadaceae bacterium]
MPALVFTVLLIFSWPLMAGVAPYPADGEVVTVEIMQNPSAVGDSEGEWFELYNTTAVPLNIDGCTLRDLGSDSHVINAGSELIVPASGFLALCRNGDTGTNGGNENCGYTYANFSLANGDDEIILDCPATRGANNEIDRVEYDGGPNFPDPNGAAMVLGVEPTSDNNDGANWVTAADVYGDGDLGSPGSQGSQQFGVTDMPPTVVETVPGNGVTGVGVASSIEVTFSEPVDASITAASIDCAGNVSFSGLPINQGSTLTLTPNSSLPFATNCVVTLLADEITDADDAGDSLDGDDDGVAEGSPADDYQFNFTTSAGCTGPATAIHAIQGNGLVSPELGNQHTIEGIVTGDFQGAAMLDGFFVQEEDADHDADPATSEGLFVYDAFGPAVDVNVGDRVRVSGTVDEFFEATQLDTLTEITVCDGGHAVTPMPAVLPVEAIDDFESFEGMVVEFAQTLTVSDVFNLVRFGEVIISDGRLMNPTNVAEPGAAALAQAQINELSQIILDDERDGSYNLPFAYGVNAANPVRNGYTLTGLTGIVDYAFDLYRLRPVGTPQFEPDSNPRTQLPAQVGGQIKVASFNVLNFFDTIDTAGNLCGPLMEGCRGADSANELQRQADKLVAAINALDADIIGLMEIENNPAASLQALVDALNTARGGADPYDYVDAGLIGDDVIKVGFIYRPANVSLVGAAAILDSPAFLPSLNRPALAQTFSHGGEDFTVAVNHFKSKGCNGASGADLDQGDGQGCYNAARTAAATELVAWLAGDPTNSNDPDVLIIGDLNAYAKEQPIDTIKTAGYTDLLQQFEGDGAYSFVFFGEAGYLDHALANDAMLAQIRTLEHWHINADESRDFDYNEESLPNGGPAKPANFYAPDAYRASDHDPIIIGLVLGDDFLFYSGFD